MALSVAAPFYDPGLIGDVVIEAEAPEGQEEAVNEVFRRAGFDVQARPALFRASLDVKPWVVDVTLAAPIAAYFVAIATEAGKDTYAAVKAWARDMFEARKDSGGGQGSIWLRDSNGTNVILASYLPDEALDALAEVDWDQVEGGYLTWDESERQWRVQFPPARD